jgi:prepilin-type N-terminal cleavage/methylation domain-containing protein
MYSMNPFFMALKPTRKLRAGFSLAEILVVIAVISLLLTLAGPLVRQASRGNSPVSIAARIASELERAKTAAASKNTYVWTYLGPHPDDPSTLQLVIWEATDGTPDRAPANLASAGPAQRFENIALSGALPAYADRPPVPAADRPDGAVWLRFSPSGEVHAAAVPATASPDEPAEVAPELTRWIELGFQPTRAGTKTTALERDTAVLHVAGLTGQIRRFAP